jgi:hypothetical protein
VVSTSRFWCAGFSKPFWIRTHGGQDAPSWPEARIRRPPALSLGRPVAAARECPAVSRRWDRGQQPSRAGPCPLAHPRPHTGPLSPGPLSPLSPGPPRSRPFASPTCGGPGPRVRRVRHGNRLVRFTRGYCCIPHFRRSKAGRAEPGRVRCGPRHLNRKAALRAPAPGPCRPRRPQPLRTSRAARAGSVRRI